MYNIKGGVDNDYDNDDGYGDDDAEEDEEEEEGTKIFNMFYKCTQVTL